MTVIDKIRNLKNEALGQIISARSEAQLESIRVCYLGRKGKVNQLFGQLGQLDVEEKKNAGQLINRFKKSVEQALADKKVTPDQTKTDWFDISQPAQRPTNGHLHLVTQAIEEITHIFEKVGFSRVRYFEVEWDWYAFEGLNMPSEHPARDDFETFYIDLPPSKKHGRAVLTPHTSSGQIREMEAIKKPPVRMVNIGKCYRPNYDISHTPMFHQFEGLVIDKGINITHLKGTCDYFARQYFGSKRVTRLRPFHFPFTEPSFEVDISCGVCGGKGCRVCKEGWVELGGAGMVHPNVLKAGGVDPRQYTGFAFGWGVERVAMMRSGLKLPDLRLFYSDDLRILNQF
ncbi:phenylalanine--tRNA ligase subunit alpha [Patescibacteria group bacterium]|nr:phenylalanine--tRNA ligase subunit alpha [Patescibacteria group bacterium]